MYKIGDKIKIIDDVNAHSLKLGDIYTIDNINYYNPDDPDIEVLDINNNRKYLGIDEVELFIDDSPELIQVSSTGSIRKNGGKPQCHHIDPEFILGMAKVLTFGAQKYSDYNWAKGNNITVPFDSAMRHLLLYMNGQNNDSETNTNHLFHAAVNLMFMYYYEKHFPEMDDRFFKDKK